MSIRNDITVDWDSSPRIIEVATPSTSLTVQDLYDTLRDIASHEVAMDDFEIVSGSGKEVLEVGVWVGLTVTLLNAKVKFEDRGTPTVCTISKGNLVAVDDVGSPMTPIQYANNVTVIYAQSSSSTIIESDASNVANAVLDELISEHTIDGSMGKVLQEAKDLSLLGI